MARKPNNYWEKRTTALMKQIEKNTEYSINQLIKVYEQATKNINKEISNIFKNFAKDSGLSKEALVQLLNKRETETHYKNLLKVINYNITDEGIKKKLLAKYNAPAYSYRISRYQQLQDNIDIELKKLADIEQQITKIRYIDTIKDAYYRNIYEIQKGLGIGFSFSDVDMRTINLLLNEKWIDKGNFSTRIWNNSEKLSNYLKTQFTADTMTGISVQKMSRQLADSMNVGLYNATRLVRTEVNHFANEGEMLSYEELDIEKYRFIATLDNVTCEHCAELDNRIFNVKDRKPGKNYPPIHPNDRCTTVAEFDNDNIENLQRRARNENSKAMLIPQDITYKEWSMQYAPEQYKKYYINPNLPRTKLVQNSILEKQLGFYNEINKLNFIPENAIISNVYIIAGKGTQTVFRSANKYAQAFGGKAQEWMKKVGKIESDKYIFDIHWVEHSKYGKYDFKLKGKNLK